MKNKKMLMIAGGAVVVLIIAVLIFVTVGGRSSGSEGGSGQGGLFGNWFGTDDPDLTGDIGDLGDDQNNEKFMELDKNLNKMFDEYAALPADKRDERKLLVDQAAMILDYQLGPNHPKKKEFLDIIGWSHDARKDLTKGYVEGKSSRADMFKVLDAHFADVAKRYAAIFSDKEYYLMFHMNKGENLAAAMGISPDGAAALDEAQKNRPNDPIPAEVYSSLEKTGKVDEKYRAQMERMYGDPIDLNDNQSRTR